MNVITMIEFFQSEYGSDVKACILWMFFHKALKKGFSTITQAEKLIPDWLQAVAYCLGAVNTDAIKGYHRSGR